MKHWEQIYKKNEQINKWPFQSVVEYLSQNYSNKSNINLLEIGCGTGNNFPLYEQLNFDFTGIDLSETACDYAIKKVNSLSKKGKVYNCNFLDFNLDMKFDLIIDRGVLAMNNWTDAKKIVDKAKTYLFQKGEYLLFDINGKNSSDFKKAELISHNYYKGNENLLSKNHKMMFLEEKDLKELLVNYSEIKINKKLFTYHVDRPYNLEFYDAFCRI